ncbi:hypothetical protein Pst134EA_013893 [Puccinia striiformis f. sp. tritici]|uniref:hypothetical protein n=1 Tax=Puccinia striiformis f. sp. tritici TaxID=168172 RepID=UPI002008DC4A|nr:hypothetical protein Pst134EA_013893 [Puccinia striiformis f. sp. tritici]KAH9466045.1 hypothetical protein Pst134EA_013893 [Puccinia striiformis f. sp. tritici]
MWRRSCTDALQQTSDHYERRIRYLEGVVHLVLMRTEPPRAPWNGSFKYSVERGHEPILSDKAARDLATDHRVGRAARRKAADSLTYRWESRQAFTSPDLRTRPITTRGLSSHSTAILLRPSTPSTTLRSSRHKCDAPLPPSPFQLNPKKRLNIKHISSPVQLDSRPLSTSRSQHQPSTAPSQTPHASNDVVVESRDPLSVPPFDTARHTLSDSRIDIGDDQKHHPIQTGPSPPTILALASPSNLSSSFSAQRQRDTPPFQSHSSSEAFEQLGSMAHTTPSSSTTSQTLNSRRQEVNPVILEPNELLINSDPPTFTLATIIDSAVIPRSSPLSFSHPSLLETLPPPATTLTGPSPPPSNLPANSNTTTPTSTIISWTEEKKKKTKQNKTNNKQQTKPRTRDKMESRIDNKTRGKEQNRADQRIQLCNKPGIIETIPLGPRNKSSGVGLR